MELSFIQDQLEKITKDIDLIIIDTTNGVDIANNLCKLKEKVCEIRSVIENEICEKKSDNIEQFQQLDIKTDNKVIELENDIKKLINNVSDLNILCKKNEEQNNKSEEYYNKIEQNLIQSIILFSGYYTKLGERQTLIEQKLFQLTESLLQYFTECVKINNIPR